MNFFKKIFSRKKEPVRIIKFGYDAARTNRWTADFITELGTINREIKNDLVAVRKRARSLWKNSSIVRAYRKRLISDVVGRDGFKLQMRCKLDNGEVDKEANDKIEWAWWEWSKKQNCTMSKTLNLTQVCYLLIESYKRDGEFFARFIENPDVNKFGFALELIEPDLLDERYNVELTNGNAIIMGIELNSWKQPVAYHFKKSSIADEMRGIDGHYIQGDRIRIPADQILHLFDSEHSNQFRGISHLAPVMVDLHNLKGYDEAAIIAARVGASKTILIERENSDETTGDEEDSEGNQLQNLSYGEIEYLNPGEKVANWTPDYPHDQYPEFIKACYRRIAVALGLNYNSLLSDLEGVNYSSMRSGLLMERDQWFVDQNFIITSFLEIVFSRWLKTVLFNSLYQKEAAIDLPYDPDKYDQPEFFGRSYQWVDPFKDSQATALALDYNLTTITRELKKQGLDFDDVLLERKTELEKMKEAGVIYDEKKNDKREMIDDKENEEDEDKEDEEKMMKNMISFIRKKSNGHFKKLLEETNER